MIIIRKIYKTIRTKYLHKFKCSYKRKCKNPLKGKFLNDIKLSDTTKGLIAGTIKSLS